MSEEFLTELSLLIWWPVSCCSSGLSLNTIWLEIQDSRFRIQDLYLYLYFREKVPDFRISKYVAAILLLYIKLLFHTKKFALSYAGAFHKNSLIVACCTFGRFEIRTLTPNRFKNQTNDTLAPLGHNYNHQRRFLKQKLLLSIVVVLT